MGLGILSDHALERVPGTAQVFEGEQRRELERNAASRIGRPDLKYDKTGKILLVPQPSDDPNDPLNWSLLRRDIILLLLSLLSVIASTLSPILAANTISLAIYFGRDLTDMALLTGYHLLGVGVAGFLFVPSARIWGKRHVYLLGNVLVVVSCVWGGAIGNHYAGFLWARVFQGVGLAPFEALVNASVGDMYHVHERGVRMALSNFCVFGGAFLTPVLVGVIADRIGYQWTFYFVAIFAGIMLPLVILFVPETAFRRDERFDIDTMGNLLVMDGEEMKMLGNKYSSITSVENEAVGHTVKIRAGDSPNQQPAGGSPRKATFLESIKPFNGRKTDERYTGAFIGALLGFALTGLVSDWSANLLTRLNNGVYEPEFRMVLVIPQLILGCAGIYGFGWTSADAGTYGWFWPDFFFALVVMGMVCGAVASALYIVDAHRGISIEAFTCLLVFKNVFSFGLTFKGFDWIVDAGRRNGQGGGGGIKELFVAVGSVQAAICALTIPMYIFGKKNRSFFHRYNIFFAVTDWVADKLTFW
ncbi:mfs transporter [Stemphylium lycopersici]|nr:mfs transporter [Stemphylium lycopersici]